MLDTVSVSSGHPFAEDTDSISATHSISEQCYTHSTVSVSSGQRSALGQSVYDGVLCGVCTEAGSLC